MTGIALLRGCDVRNRLAARDRAIVTSTARARLDTSVIEYGQRPTGGRVTGIARIR